MLTSSTVGIQVAPGLELGSHHVAESWTWDATKDSWRYEGTSCKPEIAGWVT